MIVTYMIIFFDVPHKIKYQLTLLYVFSSANNFLRSNEIDLFSMKLKWKF